MVWYSDDLNLARFYTSFRPVLKRATPYINRKRVFRQEKNTSLPEKHVPGAPVKVYRMWWKKKQIRASVKIDRILMVIRKNTPMGFSGKRVFKYVWVSFTCGTCLLYLFRVSGNASTCKYQRYVMINSKKPVCVKKNHPLSLPRI